MEHNNGFNKDAMFRWETRDNGAVEKASLPCIGELKGYGTFFDELCLIMTGFDRVQPPTEKQVS